MINLKRRTINDSFKLISKKEKKVVNFCESCGEEAKTTVVYGMNLCDECVKTITEEKECEKAD